MKNEPNLKDWAEALLHGITGDDKYSPKLVKWVEAELEDIADKYYEMGYEDGDTNAWWKRREEGPAVTWVESGNYEPPKGWKGGAGGAGVHKEGAGK